MPTAIRGDQIVTSLYEKAMNLYLYTPPHSAHPPGVLTVLVSGNILRIHSLCSKQDDINRRTKELYARLLVHRYQRDLLIPAFTKGIKGACAFFTRGSVRQCVSEQDNDTQGRVFFHMTYHLREPTSNNLQRQWRQHLLQPPWEPPLWKLNKKYKSPIDNNLMCVAYIRPEILETYSRTAKLTVLMTPLSPPIWSGYWETPLF